MSLRRTFLSSIAGLLLGAGPSLAQGYVIETGIERLESPQTLIEGLHRIYIGRQVGANFSFGQGFYSAALGDAGGAFFWGFEGVARLPLTERLSLSASGFVGGGGGASQVIGDGTMFRAGASLDYRIAPHWDLQLTASWVRIEGAPIDGAAYGLGLRWRPDGQTRDHTGPALAGVTMTAFAAPTGVRNRTGGQQAAVALAGARALFDLNSRTRLSVSAAGAASGAQGYMQVMGGIRRSLPLGRATLFFEGGAGFGGGGNVDTGAGLLIEAGVGLSLPVTRRTDVELSLGAIAAPTGDFRAASASLALVRNFGRMREHQPGDQRWAFSAGLSAQATHPGYFTGANPSSLVMMQESSIDYFVGRNLYVSGNGQTTVGGNAAGYAVGLVGLGYRLPLSDRWSVSFEGHIGAAGGGGVNTAGGIVGSLRAEVDYRIGQDWSLSLGLGRMAALRGAGMSPNLLTLGVKIPFTTR